MLEPGGAGVEVRDQGDRAARARTSAPSTPAQRDSPRGRTSAISAPAKGAQSITTQHQLLDHQEVDPERREPADEQQRVGAHEARLRPAHDRAGALDDPGAAVTIPCPITRSTTELANLPIAIVGL